MPFALEVGKGEIFLTILVVLSPTLGVHGNFERFLIMGTKMKGIYKGFKYSLTQMFVVKEPEMEIGGPTDVKHVAHIGLDGSSGSAPSWMNEYKSTGNDFAASLGGSGSGSGASPWSSREFGESMRQQSQSDEISTEGVAVVKKKERRKKPRSTTSTNSPKSNGSCSSRPSRPAKQKTKFMEDNAKTTNIEVV